MVPEILLKITFYCIFFAFLKGHFYPLQALVSIFLPAAQPTGQGKESVVLLVVVGVTTFHTTVSSNVHSKGV